MHRRLGSPGRRVPVRYVRGAVAKARERRARARRAAVSEFLGPYVHSVIATTPQGIFAVDLSDEGVGGALRAHGTFGIEHLDDIEQFFTPESRVLVVGAHVGTLVVPIARSCTEVVAIEPNPATFELLKMNLALNSIENCRALNIAASDDDTPIGFLTNTHNSGGSKRVPVVRDPAYYYDDPVEISVPAARLDELLANDLFDLVVMDIEGSEYFALRGMQRILGGCRALVVEFLPHHLQNVSGVTVEEFLVPIIDHFSTLAVPSLGETVPRAGFLACLRRMDDAGQGDDGLIFSR